MVLPRTSDADYKCFLYLREFQRRGIVRSLAPILLFDLLQSRGEDVRVYNAKRTRDLFNELASVTDKYPSLDDLREEIRRTNTARRAVRRLASLRRGFPRVTGTEALSLLGAFWMLPPDEYAALANEAADLLERRPPLAGPRVLLAGAPVDGLALHAAIESHGAVVVTEVGPWGSGLAGTDVETNGDPFAALADRYCADTLGPRTPVDELRRAVDEMLDQVDAVVVSLPPDDTVFGWDYPALRDRLDARRIPHVCIHTDPHERLTDMDQVRLVKLIAAAAVPAETRHG
jgi:benzoyl-CoA reductase/2-hydroxyglutaryl-CoA dehydratase subunit BcrC/BadD/HgdB